MTLRQSLMSMTTSEALRIVYTGFSGWYVSIGCRTIICGYFSTDIDKDEAVDRGCVRTLRGWRCAPLKGPIKIREILFSSHNEKQDHLAVYDPDNGKSFIM